SVEHKEEHSFFTPNGDGINEEWCFSNMRVSPSAKLQIFDRYGKCVFESTVSEGCWDGYYRDHVMNSGDYWYVVTDDRTGERYSGHLTLKR
ncbi:MAG: T9SS type B sorting domain-containing protein, partial [Paludibacteraceae bacterium]|nr:T9SS type B sorting domain-containing protein [Paludibacteraceae bacterium]